MIISISGTPGTGKTKVSKILAKKLRANLIDIKKLVGTEIKYRYDRKRKTKIVDEREMQKIVQKHFDSEKINIVESHLSHLIKSDFVFVLRTNPKELKKRLKKRKWNKAKIRENLEAEIIDQITAESLESNKKVFEIDTSRKKPETVVSIITKLLKSHAGNKYRASHIDWSNYYKILDEKCQ